MAHREVSDRTNSETLDVEISRHGQHQAWADPQMCPMFDERFDEHAKLTPRMVHFAAIIMGE